VKRVDLGVRLRDERGVVARFVRMKPIDPERRLLRPVRDAALDLDHATKSERPERGVIERPGAHEVRHTFGTVMARKVPLPVLQKLMGHEDIDTTVRYIDTNEDDKVDAIAAVFGRSEPLGNGRATESVVDGN
jgi:integrase